MRDRTETVNMKSNSEVLEKIYFEGRIVSFIERVGPKQSNNKEEPIIEVSKYQVIYLVRYTSERQIQIFYILQGDM